MKKVIIRKIFIFSNAYLSTDVDLEFWKEKGGSSEEKKKLWKKSKNCFQTFTIYLNRI